MSTPEGKVKTKVSTLLKNTETYYEMPVTGGYGKNSIDYIGCSKGRFFGIETKAPGIDKPTDKQRAVMDAIERAGGRTFFINDGSPAGLRELADWLAA